MSQQFNRECHEGEPGDYKNDGASHEETEPSDMSQSIRGARMEEDGIEQLGDRCRHPDAYAISTTVANDAIFSTAFTCARLARLTQSGKGDVGASL
jgi:hypothetical protein